MRIAMASGFLATLAWGLAALAGPRTAEERARIYIDQFRSPSNIARYRVEFAPLVGAGRLDRIELINPGITAASEV